jgi:hypothetical protein
MRGTPMLDKVGLANLPRPLKQEWLSVRNCSAVRSKLGWF